MARVNVKELIKVLEENFDEEAEIVIGSGKREYDVADLMVKVPSRRLVICTEGYANWKRKQKLVIR